MNASELIERGAKYYPKQTAVICQGERLTFEEVYRNANRLANGLLKLGLQKGDRVAFLLANSAQSVEIDFALLLCGLVRVPLNTRLSLGEHLHMIRESEARALLFSEAFQARVADLRANLTDVQWYCQTTGSTAAPWALTLSLLQQDVTDEHPAVTVAEQDLATIQYTSGTTGTLKAAVHTHETWVAICNHILTSLDVQAGDIMLHAAPLTHASGTLVLPHWIRGATNAVLPGFDPAAYLHVVDQEKPTTLNLVPTMIVMLLNQPDVEQYSFASVRSIIYGASPMPREALRRGIELWGAKFIQYYGQTEAPLILTLLDKDDHVVGGPQGEARLLSCGRPVSTTSLKIVDENGVEVADGTIGEICVKSNQAMVAYWKAPALTAETIKEGWVHTRDMGYIDEAGYLFLVDRKSDMIITGGFNVYPREVEEVLYQHPAVMEVAVVGVPDEKWVETVKAFVVLRPGRSASEAEIIEFCKERLASYKKPSSVEFVDSLPMSPVGKVVRRLLRDSYWEGKERPSESSRGKEG
ncbi:long-chain fatty acid--CoA ligase [Alicyclobacillus cycloheptanicus]|uniref:Acyl-CoA synthetase (AMP-forming)/AMP-acid ligase II n=1 Tax=Alicyclobacillus cycloheptanicus TaxID=1457 RepID=A0ABT9XM16_9BACL|nr:long-chain fatty acid--CoA ligase [Alicyclobacillus cycloheptanicus]MDQ0191338.1 acyl-CoA synthetase (AMP-forming)/AMP-acid ligase II [Alicyclobacillus cycloheptanicus]WDM00801.1 long-chain fatty acid--CoA ligase [Alicyclobacillus cycloheptanicus]